MTNISKISKERNNLLDVYPTSNKDDYYKYRDQLNTAFSNTEISTIAIVGSYGSGKSTLIKTHEKKSNQKYCYISALPYSFKKESQENLQTNGNSTPIIEKDNSAILEQKLVEQIYNQVSNRNNQKLRYLLYPVYSLITLAVICTYLLGSNVEYMKNFWTGIRRTLPVPEANTALFSILIIWIIYTIYLALTSNDTVSIINRIKMPSIEVQLNQQGVDFDKVKTELIRLLSKSNFSAVVVEDLDRFTDRAVIFQLREFANLYNRSTRNKKKFVFLLDFTTIDDEELRAKFFDYSINVVPYMSYSYSYSYVKEIQKLCKRGGNLSLTHVSGDLIKILVANIHDSRLLRIIISDYIFLSETYYGEKISRSLLNDKERNEIENLLFSLTIYKHILTSDYNDFLRSEGNLYSLLIKNENKQTKILNDEIAKLEREIEETKQDVLNDERELLLVEAYRLADPSYFYESEFRYSYNYFYKKNLEEAKESQNYQNRFNLLNNNYANYIDRQLEKINKYKMKVSYYTPKGDQLLEIDWSGHNAYNELLKKLLFKGFLTSKISIYISHRSDNLTPEETRLVEQAVSNNTVIDPRIKVHDENISTIMSLIDSETLSTSQLFNYNMLNHFRENKQYVSEYTQMVNNLDNQAMNRSQDALWMFFSDAYFGMAKKDQEIYSFILEDSQFYSDEFTNALFDINIKDFDDTDLLIYYLLIANLINKNSDDIIKNMSIVNFINSKLEMKHMDQAVKMIEISNEDMEVIENGFLSILLSSEVKIEFERFYMDKHERIFKKNPKKYRNLIKTKVERHQFVISKRIIQLMFFYTSSRDAKFLDLNFDKTEEREMIDYLISNPERTRDSMFVGARFSNESDNLKFWIENETLRKYSFTERLVNELGIDNSVEIFEGIENLSSEKVPKEFKKTYDENTDMSLVRWFENLSEFNEDIAVEIFKRKIFKINQENINYIFDLYLDSENSEKLFDSLLTFDYSKSTEFILKYKKVKLLFGKLFEDIATRHNSENLTNLIITIPSEILNLCRFTMEDAIEDSDSRDILLEYGLINPTYDTLIYLITVGDDKTLNPYMEEVKNLITEEKNLIFELIENDNIRSLGSIIEVMKFTNQFNQEIFRKLEKSRNFIKLSNNKHSKSFKKPLDNKVKHELTILIYANLVKITTDNRETMTIKIEWQN